MDLKGYDRKVSDNFLEYEFYSEGPKGRIKKMIRFAPYNDGGIIYFNLSFGDWDDEKKRIDDLAVSNNQDRNKILLTVASVVLEFIEHFPGAFVYAEGSTSARTRLYQMGITTNWNKINKLLNVYGYTKINGWQPFRKRINYESFIVFRK